MESHLLQMRGLKLNNRRFDLECEVASFTDAWIETFNPEFDHIGYQSHLLQMRGLKHRTITLNGVRQQSHLLQMRGLKLFVSWNAYFCGSRIFYRCVD